MPAGLTYEQMFRVPYIMGLISRIYSPGNTFSSYYGLGVTGRVAQQIQGRVGQYDIFDGTRSLIPMSAPDAPATRLNRKPAGTQPITLPRIYASIGMEDNKIFGTRPLGVNVAAPVSDNGKMYFANQISYAKTRLNNSHEFMAVRMFSGGFGLKPRATGSHILDLAEFTDGSNIVTNPTLIPSGNKTDAGGIINVSWDNFNADLNGQLMDLNRRAAQVNGRTLTDIWVNGTTGKHLFNNVKLMEMGGSSYRIFDTLNPNKEIGPGQKFPDTGVTVVFRALPNFLFHIYNQGYVLPGTSEAFTDQIGANWRPFIPDSTAIITPRPGEWCGMVQGSEMMQWNLRESTSTLIEGFGMGSERAIEPPRTDVKFLYNGAPVITEPYAVYYLTVLF